MTMYNIEIRTKHANPLFQQSIKCSFVSARRTDKETMNKRLQLHSLRHLRFENKKKIIPAKRSLTMLDGDDKKDNGGRQRRETVSARH